MNNLKRGLIVILFLTLGVFTTLKAQEVNPRVVEVENIIKDSVSEYVSNILPGSHFLVSVKVTPLRRTMQGYTPKGEILPYFEMTTNEIRDEWDDPTVSIFRLFRRIASSEIKIIFTSELKLKNQQQFISDLISYANLVPSRDRVVIESRTSIIQKKTDGPLSLESRDIKYIILLFLLLVGLGLIARFAFKNGNTTTSSGAPAPAPMPIAAAVTRTTPATQRHVGGGISGDLSLTDPTKTMEIVRTKIDDIVGTGAFPTLNDMIELEKLAEENPASFSALIYEFPLTHQQDIFQYGRGELWYKCFSGVGQIDRSVLNTLDKMLRERTLKGSEIFEKLLIQAWRMEDQIDAFLEKMDREYAYSILYYLPKSISIPVGRRLFAGSWGDLVGARKIPPIDDSDLMKNLIHDSYEIKPLLSYQSLEAYKNSRDLLEYLKFAGVKEEQDIYSVVGKSSDLYSLRPPFFTFFNLTKDKRDLIFENFSLQDWALAIFDTEREYRKIIDEHLDDKQKFLLSTFLRDFDANSPSLHDRGLIREEVGKAVAKMLKKLEIDSEAEHGMEVAESIEMDSSAQENSIDDVA